MLINVIYRAERNATGTNHMPGPGRCRTARAVATLGGLLEALD